MMTTGEWLSDLQVSQETPVRGNAAQSPRDRSTALHTQRCRRQGEKIKSHLSQTPAAQVVPQLLNDMREALGVRLDLHSLEKPGCRLLWKVTFRYESPATYRYFIVKRLFAGQELDPQGHSHYLGPDWEAPEAWLEYTDEELLQLLSQEEIVVRSGAGKWVVSVENSDWQAQLQRALREAYRFPFQHAGD